MWVDEETQEFFFSRLSFKSKIIIIKLGGILQ